MATNKNNTVVEKVLEQANDTVQKFSKSLPKKVENEQANLPKDKEREVKTKNNGIESDDIAMHQSLVAKEFFWDDLLSYLASAILALALVDISVEFLAGSNLGLLCLTPISTNATTCTTDFDRDQSAFINSFCSRYLSLTEFYPLFTLVQGIALFSPHHIWLSIYSKYFNFFFALVSMIQRLRERNTGSYIPKNTAIIRRLEQEFANQSTILSWYWVKLITQGLLYLLFIFLTFGLFRDFEEDITCPPLSEESLPDFGRVKCVYARFRLLNVLRIANGVILLLGLVVILVGVYNLSTSEFLHVKALGYNKVAKFSYHSALDSSFFYSSQKRIRFPHFSLGASDMDFMHFKLFATDAGYANILRDNQVTDQVSKLLEADYQRQYIYDNVSIEAHDDSRVDLNVLSPDYSSDCLEDFIDRVCDRARGTVDERGSHLAALDISFHRHSYVFSMAKKFDRVASIHFDEHYHSVAKNDIYSIGDLYSIKVPTNILALPYEQIEKLSKIIAKFLEWKRSRQSSTFQFCLIVVSGVDDVIKGATVSQMIEILSSPNNQYITDGALLLVLTLHAIEGKQTKRLETVRLYPDRYWKSERFPEEFCPMMSPHRKRSDSMWDEEVYVSRTCGETKCSFRCSLYKYAVTTRL